VNRRRVVLAAAVIAVIIGAFVFIGRVTHPVRAVGVPVPRSGEQIAFIHAPPGDTGDIYILETDTGDITRLTRSKGIQNAAWSPDGDRLVIAHLVDSRVFITRLIVLDVRNGDIVKLVSEPENYTLPQWSPDSRQLVYSYGNPNRSDHRMVLVTADGTQSRDIGQGIAPAWSPNGTQITYTDWSEEHESRVVYAMNPDEGVPHPLITHEAVGYLPKWAPDGEYISFIGLDTLADWNTTNVRGIYIADNDGENVQPVADTFRWDSMYWSPDGQYILYKSTEGVEFCTLDVPSSTSICKISGYSPRWHFDGEHIIFLNADGQICIGTSELTQQCFDTDLEGDHDNFLIIGVRP